MSSITGGGGKGLTAMSRFRDILDEQERAEAAAYQSDESILAMMRQDFSDAELVEAQITRHERELVRLFQMRDLTALSAWHIPIRTCGFIHAAKHTRSQVAYFHNHDCYELILAIHGTCIQRFLDPDSTLTLSQSDACLNAPGTVHAIEPIDADQIIIKIMIAPSVFDQTFAPILREAERSESSSRQAPRIRVFRHCSDLTAWLVRMLTVEASDRLTHWRSTVPAYCSLIAAELARNAAGECTTFSPLAHSLERYVRSDPAHADLAGFARMLGYSEDYTGRLVRESTGRTFRDLTGTLRMGIAASRLLDTDDTVTSIAHAVGYNNRSGFHKRFLSVYGLTPSEYRSMFRMR